MVLGFFGGHEYGRLGYGAAGLQPLIDEKQGSISISRNYHTIEIVRASKKHASIEIIPRDKHTISHSLSIISTQQ